MLALTTRTPAQTVAADATLRRLKPTTDQLAAFQKQLAKLLRHLDPTKIERHGETHILNFLGIPRPPWGRGRLPSATVTCTAGATWSCTSATLPPRRWPLPVR